MLLTEGEQSTKGCRYLLYMCLTLCKGQDACAAIKWLARTEGPGIVEQIKELGDRNTCVLILQVVFTECKSAVEKPCSFLDDTFLMVYSRRVPLRPVHLI